MAVTDFATRSIGKPVYAVAKRYTEMARHFSSRVRATCELPFRRTMPRSAALVSASS